MSDCIFQLTQGSKAYGSRVLFDRATFAINDDEHVGVIGPNGAGKTTLFKILTGQETLDSGEVIRSRGISVGYLPQYDAWNTDDTLESFLESSTPTPLWELKALGKGLGLTEVLFSKKISQLSGGFRMRVKLLKLLGEKPNLLLLDEPTNYLDLETVFVLESFLQEYRGAFLLISHDREFLRRVTDHTLEIEMGQITKFNGHIDDYFEQKELLRSQLEKTAANQEARRAEIQSFVDRFRAKATKAAQAQARIKMLEKMETIELKPLPIRARIPIPTPECKTGKKAISMKQGVLGYGGTPILSKVDLDIQIGDHVGVVGVNGAGKSTLLKSLAGVLPLQSGTRELGFQLQETPMGYYAQHVTEALSVENTVYRELEKAASILLPPQQILDLAGALLFSGDDIRKGISKLSGGERSRVALGKILLARTPCLLLDEPTNHLDFFTVETLTQALHEYPGTLIVVSHDRSFIGRVANKILEIRDGTVSLYPGTYEDYLWRVQREQRSTGTSNPKNVADGMQSGGGSVEGPSRWEQKKTLEAKLRAHERRILQIETELPTVRHEIVELADGFSAGVKDPQVLRDYPKKLAAAQSRLDHLEAEWLKLEEEKELFQQELSQIRGG